MCDKCNDTYFILVKDEFGRTVAKDCECRARHNLERYMRASGITEEDLNKGFSDFKTFGEQPLEFARNTCMEYVKKFNEIQDERNNSLLLCGASGRGKTLLALATTNNLLHMSIPVLYAPYRETVTELKQDMLDNQEKYREKMNRFKTVAALFVDDLFKGEPTKADVNYIYEIVNYRYLKRLPMIISTECSCEKLLAIDEAIGGRIIEMSKGAIVEFSKDTPNYRLR